MLFADSRTRTTRLIKKVFVVRSVLRYGILTNIIIIIIRKVVFIMEEKVYIYHIKLRCWYKVFVSMAKEMVENGCNTEYHCFKTRDLKYIDLT